MECPKCGFVLIDDRWICENCGTEIQIVPDFELELENSISEVLLNVADEINPRPGPDDSGLEDLREEELKILSPGDKRIIITPLLKRWILVAAGLLVFAAVCIFISITVYRNNSAPYHINRANSYAASGDYERAVTAMARADRIRPYDAEIRLSWAAYCYANKDYDLAIEILLSMIGSPQFSWAEKDVCYDRLISIWDELERYQEINDLLILSRDVDLMNEYHYYLSPVPEFSEEAGNYTGSLLLNLSSEIYGNIYYTLDGSEPTKESKLFINPIILEAGDYQVSAVFENIYGILSDIVTYEFFIDIRKTDPPVILQTDGWYIVPTEIVVEVPEDSEVYYTIDTSLPTEESEKYLGPFMMTLGNHTYNFVAISLDGIPSEIISREFDYRLNSEITPEKAIENVMLAHLKNQRIINMNGKAATESGYYEYIVSSVIEIYGKGLYYMVEEYYYESGADSQKTGHIFAAAAYTGEAVHLIYNDQGILDAILL